MRARLFTVPARELTDARLRVGPLRKAVRETGRHLASDFLKAQSGPRAIENHLINTTVFVQCGREGVRQLSQSVRFL